MSEDRIEALFLERARLRSLGAPSQMYRATSTGFSPITFEPGPESNPILGGNEIQGFAQPTADDAMQERAPSNEVGGRMSDLAANALQLLGDDFGAAYQQFRIGEVENRIEDGSLQPVDYQMAVIENPTVPLGDYYDAASGTFSGVPSDDYILHQGQLYPRVITDAQTGEEIDLSEDNQLINFGRALMAGFLDPVGVPTIARGVAGFVKGGAPDPTVMNMGLGGATVPVDRAADVSDIGFYSAVNRAVEALPMEKGSASQMRAMIAKGEGVKPEEMAWIGLDDFLKGKKSVTKAEVQEYVQANQVQIQEVVKGDLDTANIRVELIDGEHHLINDAGEIIDTYPGDAQGALDAVNAIPPNTNRPLSDTKFASYTLPGGENYREVLLTLPKPKPVSSTQLPDGYEVAPLEGHPTAKYTLVNPSGVGTPVGGSTLEEATEQAINRLSVNPPKSEEFRGPHFEEPNVLAHMRLNDRTGPNGERILFIEEIQSDWHQKGRKSGYGKDGVPDAPMKKTWHEMSFRRVARMAAEEGYDAIAWTPGKMQAERYDLSKQVDEIRAIRNEDGSFKVYAVQERGGGLGDVLFDRDNLDIAGVEELVGKDLAEKIQGQNKVEEAYTGIDLQVGGEGMKGFYDKMLKNYAAKWGKKFGAKVGLTDIKSREYTQGEPVETGVPINEMNDQQLLGQLGYSNIEDVETKVWTLPVTKKMRDSLMKKGAPLFTAGGAVAMSQVEREQNDN